MQKAAKTEKTNQQKIEVTKMEVEKMKEVRSRKIKEIRNRKRKRRRLVLGEETEKVRDKKGLIEKQKKGERYGTW